MSEQSVEIQITQNNEQRKITPRKPLARRSIKRELSKERERATHDPLTGLLNRAGFTEMFNHEIARIKRSVTDSQLNNHPVRQDSKAIIIYFDLNEFKLINEKFGHAGGDEQLKKTAATMIDSSRPSDIIARMGGDEFVMVLPGNDLASGKVYWEENLLPALKKNNISISAGVCELDPEHPEGSIALADQFQDKAKQISRTSQNSTQIVFANT